MKLTMPALTKPAPTKSVLTKSVLTKSVPTKSVLTRPVVIILVLALLVLTAAGCSGGGSGTNQDGSNPEEQQNGSHSAVDYSAVERYEGEESLYLSSVYTVERKLALTFSGLPDESGTTKLLAELDRFGITATFFVPGMRAAEEPELVQAIAERGHEVENNTLTRADMSALRYADLYKEIHLGKTIIEEASGTKARFIRTRSGDDIADVRLAAAHSGMQAAVGRSLQLKDSHLDKELMDTSFLRLYTHRGSIVEIDLERNSRVPEMLPKLAAAAADVGYRYVPLGELVDGALEKKPLEQILGYDAARHNLDLKQANPKLVYQGNARGSGGNKEVALTLDDWGTDYTVTAFLDILARYDVKATFFLRANGVERNPNLARAIREEGHEIANHSYSHPVVTGLSDEELQHEIVLAHQILTEAIQEQPTMLFRPPTGAIDDRTARVIAATGYETIAMYDVTVFDWDASNDADQLVSSVMEQTKAGSVLLLHILDDIHTVEALPRIIEGLQEQGYSIVTMSEMLK